MKRLALLALAACGSKAPAPQAADHGAPDAGVIAPSDPDTTPDVLVVQGKALRKQGDAAGSAQGLVRFQEACDRDYAIGCELVGETLTNWQYYGVAQDDHAAAVAFDKGCTLGNGHACYRYGFDLEQGLLHEIVGDWTAESLIERGCKLGEQEACSP